MELIVVLTYEHERKAFSILMDMRRREKQKNRKGNGTKTEEIR